MIHGEAVRMATATEHRYVAMDEDILDGEPIIKGTRTPVRAIVELWRHFFMRPPRQC